MKSIKSLLKQAKNAPKQSSLSEAEKKFQSEQEAFIAFGKYKENLLYINCWNESANLSSYQLSTQNNEIVKNGKIAENLLIRISLKGTGKFDWVKVTEIDDNPNEFILTVQPTFDPTDKESKAVSHFFTDEARNNFCLELKDSTVFFYIIGLNEKQNLVQTDDFVEAIRNWVTANVGTYLGIQKGEWTTFANKFLQ